MQQLIRYSIAVLILCVSAPSFATDYRAIDSGEWSDPSIWSPNGVPGLNDTVLGLGSNDVTVSNTQEIGDGTANDAITLDGEGRLTLDSGATLTLHGNFHADAYRAEIVIRDDAELLFNPSAGQVFHFQQSSSEQRVTFSGQSSARGKIGLAPGAAGHYFFLTEGFRDSRINGSYGMIEDAFDPVSELGWEMYMDNEPGASIVEADHIEFVRCGGIRILGLGAGEFTQVRLDALTFRDQAKSGMDFNVAQFWFDGYGDEAAVHPVPALTNYVTNVVSDTEINIRFVQDYVLDNYVLDWDGSGHARATNNGGNAESHSNVFIALNDGGKATSLIANTTENSYIYTEADNPHGWSTHQLRGDALLRNYWFESHQSQQSDNGDAVLTNGPQRFVDEYNGAVPTLILEHSGTIGDSLGSDKHPVLFSFNESTGIQLLARHNVARVAADTHSIALDENGLTPTGAGLALTDNVFFFDALNGMPSGYGIGSASGPQVINSDTFNVVDYNLYWQLGSDGTDGSLGVHQAPFSAPIDVSSVTMAPHFFDSTRTIATWDASLGGPGTARHAIEEMKKRNDDSGFDPNYDVTALIEYVAKGFAVTHAQAIASDGLRMGPTLHLPAVAPVILTEPQSQTVSENELVTLSVENIGVPLPDYQWQFDGNDIAGAIGHDYSFTALPADAGDYSVEISNASGSVTSEVAIVEVDSTPAAPTITTQPESITVIDGATASFSVVASGSPAPSYQWRKGANEIPGETDATLSFTAQPSDAGNYRVRVTNAEGSVLSSSATLTVDPLLTPPTITTQPADITVASGATASFSVIATGNPAPEYQWQKDGSDLNGETQSSLSFTTVAADAGDYQVLVTNSQGDVLSAVATLIVDAAETAPTITTQPADSTVTEGETASFSVVAVGNPAPAFQWQKDGSDISGETSATYSITTTAAGDAGSYSVVATNSEGSVTSDAATLVITPALFAPSITVQPADLSIVEGATANFVVETLGNPQPDYQWRKDGVDIAGATNALLSFTTSQNDAGAYDVVVSNSEGSIVSNVALLELSPLPSAPTITLQPENVSVSAGDNAVFSVVANGNPTPDFQWRKDGADIAGETSDTLTLLNTTLADAAGYDVEVSNSEGQVTSDLVTLSVQTDTVLPTIISSVALNETTVVVSFSEPMTNSVELLANYSIDQGVQVLAAVQNSPEQVTLTTTALTSGVSHLLLIVGVQDIALNSIATDATTNFEHTSSGALEIAFVVANPASLTSGDATVESLLQAQGHSVVRVDDNSASPGSTVSSDVVVISATVSHLAIGASFIDDPRPIMLWEYRLYDDMALTDSSSFGRYGTSNRAIDIVDLSIGIGDSLGSLNLTTNNRKDGWGMPVASATIVATLDGDATRATIFSYDAGDQRADGGSFAGRRLAWPHGFAEVWTADANSLFEQAIQWLGGGSMPSIPSITTQPQSQNIPDGEDVTFTVVASGAGISYQWLLDGNQISNATAASFTTTATNQTSGDYTVAVTNTAGSVLSNAATLILLPALSAPSVLQQPADISVSAGSLATFSATVDGNPAPTVQWQRNGADLPGATATTLSFTATLTDAGTYQLIATNSEGAAVSATALLEVSQQPAAPVIVTQPADATVVTGADITFTVVATGNPTPTYQWRKGGTNLPGEITDALNLINVDVDQAGSYDVIVTNSEGSVTSTTAILSIDSDTLAPSLLSANALSLTSVELVFSEAMSASVELLTNYSINQGAVVTDATQTATDTVQLATTTLQEGTNYSVTATNVEDLAGNTIAAGATASFSVAPSSLQVALVMASPANPAAADAAIISSIEALGHTVVRVDDDVATPATTVGSDLVAISVSISHTKVGAAFLNDPRPVMIWEYLLYDDMQLTGTNQGTDFDRSGSSSTDIDVIDLSLGIGDSLGSTSITSRSRRYAWGVAGQDATVVATLDNDPSRAAVFAYEAGAARVGGGSFAGRRLAWPTGSANVFTNQGTALFADAISWLANGGTPPVGTAPSIVSAPADLTISEGELATFAVTAAGDPQPTLQWQKDGSDILGETSSTLSFSAALVDAGSYRVIATNLLGSVTSTDAQLTVNQQPFAPVISSQPQAAQIDEGENTVFTVVATGNPSPEYQWRKDGAALASATASSLNLTSVTTADAGTYDVVVTNAQGSIISDAAELTVLSDTTAPTLQNLSAVDTSTLQLTFSEPMTASVTLLSNYSIDQGVAVLGASQESPTTVTLTTSIFNEATNYTLTTTGVQDLALNTIQANTTASFSLSASSVEFAFVVPNPSNLSNADSAVKNILEALGHTVALVDDNFANPTTTSASQVVVISSTVSHSKLNAKFLDDTRPLFTWEYQLYDDLGLTGSGSGTNFGRDTLSNKNLNLVDTSIGIGTSVGTIQITSGNRKDAWGIPATSAAITATLENDNTRATIFSYSAGDGAR